MSLALLLNASPVIQIHAVAAMSAFALGVVQFAAPKGTIPHRTVGWIWVALMLIVAATAFGIQEIRPGKFSPIHILGIVTLVTVPLAVLHARRHNVKGHSRSMIGIFFGALIIAGLFAFLPGRLMYKVAFGG
jgi:uncharacterized membrane protein